MKTISKQPDDQILSGLRSAYPKIQKLVYAFFLSVIFLHLAYIKADSTLLQSPQPEVEISAASGETIEFLTQNGKEISGSPPRSYQLPHLVLLRNGVLTASRERTLLIEINNLQLPYSGTAVHLEVRTQHAIHERDQATPENILAWQETRLISSASESSSGMRQVTFRKEFDDQVEIDSKQLSTPTDYYQVDIFVTDPNHPLTNPLYEIHQDFAFLLENQWVVDLPLVDESAAGAAPSELVLYYYDMLPIHRELNRSGSLITREAFGDYLITELVPAMQSAFQTESVEWGFTWHPEWRGYRPGEQDNQLNVSLTDGSTWYHGQAHPRGSGGISLRVDSPENAMYQNLTDSLISSFYHELFHNLQRSLNLHLGGSGDVDGLEDAWAFFSEGTAVVASSVGQPEVQFSCAVGLPDYFMQANGFLAGGGQINRDLNRSYQEINPYHAAIYWRYLYEQCGGMSLGGENPQDGMQIIRNVLSVLYSKTLVDSQSSVDLVEHLPAIMDAAIQETPTCPFTNYRESLLSFATAIYSLHFDQGRCVAPGYPAGCAMYDPAQAYLYIPLPEFTYKGELLTIDSSKQPFPAGIQSSYGMDFIQINLAGVFEGQSLTIELLADAEGQSEFNVQVFEIDRQQNGRNLLPVIEQGFSVEKTQSPNLGEQFSFPISENTDLLGLVITRMDSQEVNDRAGDYTIQVYQ
ncbi:MAG: hypothetical protein ACWGOY_03825 [Anaerolineales bacterium]